MIEVEKIKMRVKYEISEIGEVIGGATPSTKDEDNYGGDISWITPKDLSSFTERYIYRGERNISEKGLHSCSAKLMPKDTVLFSSRAPIGYVAIAANKLCTNQGFKSIIADESKIHYLYLYYYLIYKKSEIEAVASGTTFKEVSGSVLKKFKIEIHESILEQRAIADTLSCLDDMIELNNRTNKVLEEMAQAIFKHWFVDFEFPNENGEPYKSSGGEMVDSELGEIPRGWDVGVLSDLADITMGQSPPGSSYNSSGEGMIFFQGRTDFGHRFPSVRLYTTEPKRIASKGETLLSVRAPVGDINKALETCCIGRGLSALESKLGYNSYIYYCLQGSVAILDIFNAEGTVFGSITKKTLSNIHIVISPEKQMKKFEFTVNEIDRIIENNFEENLIISSVRDTLLPKLMSGEIRVPIEEVG